MYKNVVCWVWRDVSKKRILKKTTYVMTFRSVTREGERFLSYNDVPWSFIWSRTADAFPRFGLKIIAHWFFFRSVMSRVFHFKFLFWMRFWIFQVGVKENLKLGGGDVSRFQKYARLMRQSSCLCCWTPTKIIAHWFFLRWVEFFKASNIFYIYYFVNTASKKVYMLL